MSPEHSRLKAAAFIRTNWERKPLLLAKRIRVKIGMTPEANVLGEIFFHMGMVNSRLGLVTLNGRHAVDVSKFAGGFLSWRLHDGQEGKGLAREGISEESIVHILIKVVTPALDAKVLIQAVEIELDDLGIDDLGIGGDCDFEGKH